MATTRPPEALPIAVIGANDRMRDTIELFFRGPCAARYVLSREQDARITIADLDGVRGRDLLESHRQRYPHLPVIALTVRDSDIEGVQVLRKPLQMEVLEKAIEVYREDLEAVSDQQVAPPLPVGVEPVELNPATAVQEKSMATMASPGSEALTSLLPASFPPPRRAIKPVSPERVRGPSTKQPLPIGAHRFSRAAGEIAGDRESLAQICCGSFPDVDPADVKEHGRVFYSPTTFLQGHLERTMENARRRRSVVRLGLARDRNITLLPRAAVVFTNMSDRVLRPCALFSMQDAEIQTNFDKISEERLMRETEVEPVSYAAFLWRVTLWSARGRVPMGTSLTHGVELLRWPNYTRLLAGPSFPRISALWARGSYSLLDTAAVLDIPQRQVFALFSACRALQITRIGSSIAPPQELSATPAILRQRQLFSRIAQHLRKCP